MSLFDRWLGKGGKAGEGGASATPEAFAVSPLIAARLTGDLSYEDARELAAHSDPAIRRLLAQRQDLRPELLYFLAEDSDPEVRRLIARNQAAPRHADLLLARDADAEVRVALAAKIAQVAPGLSRDEQDKLRRMAYETLELLTRDAITRVRQNLAEVLKDLADAPSELVLRLARDTEIVVSGPILQFSPVLTDEDLVAIIAASPIPGAIAAISRRVEVRPQVADAIASSDDVDAIAVLLANPSAQIREETLDRLIDRAVDHENWHVPLVRRPVLPPKAAGKLARIVADNLLEVLRSRADLDAATLAAITDGVLRRLDMPTNASDGVGSEGSTEEHLVEAHRLYRDGLLTETLLSDALQRGKRDFVLAALSVLAGLSLETIRKIIINRSAKGTVSLAWKAGLSAQFAHDLQISVTQISRKDALPPDDGGRFPLTVEEMTWQIELFQSMH